MRHRFTFIVAATLVLSCKELPAKLTPGQEVAIKGEIIAGVECPMIVAPSARRFALAGDIGRFKVGDRVCVHGTVAEMSFCMAGEATISIKSIGPATDCR